MQVAGAPSFTGLPLRLPTRPLSTGREVAYREIGAVWRGEAFGLGLLLDYKHLHLCKVDEAEQGDVTTVCSLRARAVR